MATTSLTNVFRRDAFVKVMDFSADTFRWPLYNGSGHSATTTAYTLTAEASGSGYSAGGVQAVGATAGADAGANTNWYDWTTDPSYSNSSITATDMMLYDDTVTTPTANMAIGIFDFNGPKTSSSGTFTVVLPAAAASTAIVRLA